MKKTSWYAVLGTLLVVLVLSFLCTQFLLPLINEKTYSETNCLNDQITGEMDVYDIAKLYRDSNATCAVIVKGQSTEISNSYISSLGSGVAIASKGYEIQTSEGVAKVLDIQVLTNNVQVQLLSSGKIIDFEADQLIQAYYLSKSIGVD